MTLDITKYRPYLDGFDLTDDQKTAMIEALWSIAETVADLTYGLHSSQLIQTANDNDSISDSRVIEFFSIAAQDPALDELSGQMDEVDAANDNTPHTQRQKEAAT